MFKEAEKITVDAEGDVFLENMQLEYFMTKVNQAKGANRQKLFGHLRQAEEKGSTAKKRKYFTVVFEFLPSGNILASFSASTYITHSSKKVGAAQSTLHTEHVEQAARFAAVSTRWLSWVKKNKPETSKS